MHITANDVPFPFQLDLHRYTLLDFRLEHHKDRLASIIIVLYDSC